ncbi:hypothetical protein D3C81_1990510 [compost metagenome]
MQRFDGRQNPRQRTLNNRTHGCQLVGNAFHRLQHALHVRHIAAEAGAASTNRNYGYFANRHSEIPPI